jgi:phosphomannomutase
MRPLSAILKTNDLRGAVPQQWGPVEARALGVAIAEFFAGQSHLLVGHDMRVSGAELARALSEGVASAGMDVLFIGQVSTDTLYYASGSMNLPGAVLTASHNPAGDNGVKLVGPGARPIGAANGLRQIVQRADRCGGTDVNGRSGGIQVLDVLPEFAGFLRQTVDLSRIRPLKVVIDAGNGMGGIVADAAFGMAAGTARRSLGALDIVRLYFEPDGTFPNHEPNPLEPANLRDLQQAVADHRADLGLAFDGDADRCFTVDEKSALVPASVVGSIIALREVARERATHRPATVVHNAITSQALPELLQSAGARTVRTRVGHSVIKPTMAELDAVFGAEHSGHFYFRDFYYADSGVLSAMHVLAALGSQPLALSELAEVYSPYISSGELNFKVPDIQAAIQKVQMTYADDVASGAVSLDSLDGLTVSHWGSAPRWWANVRPSNTESLLRLNVEAEDEDVMVKVRDGIAGILVTAPRMG